MFHLTATLLYAFHNLLTTNPLVSSLDSHITDTTNFLNKLSNLRNLHNDAVLVTLDVSLLYTNIPHNQGIDSCCHFLDTPSNKHSPTETKRVHKRSVVCFQDLQLFSAKGVLERRMDVVAIQSEVAHEFNGNTGPSTCSWFCLLVSSNKVWCLKLADLRAICKSLALETNVSFSRKKKSFCMLIEMYAK